MPAEADYSRQTLAASQLDAALVPNIFAALALWSAAVAIAFATNDTADLILASVALASGTGCIGVSLWLRRELRKGRLVQPMAFPLILSQLLFAITLGVFASYNLFVGPERSHIAMVALVMGYCGSTVVLASARSPLILIYISASLGPPIAALFFSESGFATVSVLIILCFVVAGAVGLRQQRQFLSDRDERQSELQAVAPRDPLTGLFLRETLEPWVAQAAFYTPDALLTLYTLDIDRFRIVNEQHGETVGDQILRELGARLRETVRGDDLVVRFDGDEFLVVQRDTDVGLDEDTTPRAEDLARRIISVIQQPFHVSGRDITVGVSVGFVSYRLGTQKFSEALANAQKALALAKEQMERARAS